MDGYVYIRIIIPITMNEELKQYIESEIIPRYAFFDKAHGLDHAGDVIARALDLGRHYDVSEDILYAAAAYHDTGLAEGRETHHLASGRIIREDVNLAKWFSPEEIETIAQAAEDHRASSGSEPRGIYGKIIAEADRLIDPETVIRRCIQFGLDHEPELNRAGQFERTYSHLVRKYGDGGYLRLWITESPNAEKLEELRGYIRDREKLIPVFDRLYRREVMMPLVSERYLTDERYRNGHIRIINCKPGTDIVGLHTPQQKLLAKEVAKRDDWRGIIEDLSGSFLSGRGLSYEGRMIWGFAINYVKCDIEERLAMMSDFVKAIDGWSVCDQFCCSAKWVKKWKPQVWKRIVEMSIVKDSDLEGPERRGTREFYVRTAVIMAMSYFLGDEKELSATFSMINGISLTEGEPYYIRMGVAWCLATALAKHPDSTREYLSHACIPEDILKLYVRKVRESRITREAMPF